MVFAPQQVLPRRTQSARNVMRKSNTHSNHSSLSKSLTSSCLTGGSVNLASTIGTFTPSSSLLLEEACNNVDDAGTSNNNSNNNMNILDDDFENAGVLLSVDALEVAFLSSCNDDGDEWKMTLATEDDLNTAAAESNEGYYTANDGEDNNVEMRPEGAKGAVANEQQGVKEEQQGAIDCTAMIEADPALSVIGLDSQEDSVMEMMDMMDVEEQKRLLEADLDMPSTWVDNDVLVEVPTIENLQRRCSSISTFPEEDFDGSHSSSNVIPLSPNVTMSRSNSDGDAPMRCAMAKLANSIQRTAQSRNGLLSFRQEDEQLRRRNSAPTPDVAALNKKPSSSSSQSQVPSRRLSFDAMTTRDDAITRQKRSASSTDLSSNDNSSMQEYGVSSFLMPRRTSQEQAQEPNHQPPVNHHRQQPPPPPRNSHFNHTQQIAPAAYAAVPTAPQPSTLMNHADFANGRRLTLTDSLDESRQRLVSVARQTGVGLMTAATMAKWGVAAQRTTQGIYH